MDKNIFRVIKGYSELSFSERKEIRKLIDQYEEENITQRKDLIESFQHSLGPTSDDTCPCCGR